jgi:hypothetical protein
MTETGVVGVALAVVAITSLLSGNVRFAWGFSFNWFAHSNF